jgi:hypothetical protein
MLIAKFLVNKIKQSVCALTGGYQFKIELAPAQRQLVNQYNLIQPTTPENIQTNERSARRRRQ